MNSLKCVTRIKLAAAAAGMFGLVAAMPAVAADSVDVTVNATIKGVCKFFTTNPVLDITNTGTGDEIDPSATGPATGDVEITYRCSKGTTPTFTVPTSVVLAGPTESMTATLTSTNDGAGTGMGSAQDKTLTVSGSIAQTEYEDKEVGTYTADVTVEIDP